jgi:hypothetical protein
MGYSETHGNSAEGTFFPGNNENHPESIPLNFFGKEILRQP